MKTWLNHLGTHLMWRKIQNCFQTSQFGTSFWGVFWCCNTTILGSNPDRSPAAQWLNMRILLASRLPPGSQLPAPGSRGPVKTLSGPARRWREARTAGKVLRNQHRGRNFAYIQNSCPEAPARRCRQARASGKVFRNHNSGRNFA